MKDSWERSEYDYELYPCLWLCAKSSERIFADLKGDIFIACHAVWARIPCWLLFKNDFHKIHWVIYPWGMEGSGFIDIGKF